MGEIWKAVITDSFNKFLAKILTFLPNLLAMITILIVGFIIAWIFKRLVLRFLSAIQFDKLSRNWGLSEILLKGGLAYSPSNLLGRFCYWVIVLITLILGVNALEVTVTQPFISRFFNYIPHLFAVVIILIIGYLIAIFLSQATLIAAVNAQIDSAKLISRAVRWFIIILSLSMALYHLGIAENMIVAAFSIILGGVVLALAIAFGWGGREIAKEFLEKITRKKEKENEGSDKISHL